MKLQLFNYFTKLTHFKLDIALWWEVGPRETNASIKWCGIEEDIGKKTLFTSNRQTIWLTSISPRFLYSLECKSILNF